MDSYTKDPQAVLDYKIDWSAWLSDDDTIVGSSWSSDQTGITIGVSEYTDTQTVVWLSDGEVGSVYRLTNHVVTAQGREDDRSIKVRIKNK